MDWEADRSDWLHHAGLFEISEAAMCDWLMNAFILIPSHPESTLSSIIRQSRASCCMEVYVCLMSDSLFYLFPSDWPSGPFKYVPPHKRCVQTAESSGPCDIQNTSKSTKPDSSSWIFPLLVLQPSGWYGGAFGGTSGIGLQCHSLFSLLCVLTYSPNHLLHPQWHSACGLPGWRRRRSSEPCQLSLPQEKPLLQGGVGTVGCEPGDWCTGILCRLSRSCGPTAKKSGENQPANAPGCCCHSCQHTRKEGQQI